MTAQFSSFVRQTISSNFDDSFFSLSVVRALVLLLFYHEQRLFISFIGFKPIQIANAIPLKWMRTVRIPTKSDMKIYKNSSSYQKYYLYTCSHAHAHAHTRIHTTSTTHTTHPRISACNDKILTFASVLLLFRPISLKFLHCFFFGCALEFNLLLILLLLLFLQEKNEKVIQTTQNERQCLDPNNFFSDKIITRNESKTHFSRGTSFKSNRRQSKRKREQSI